MVDKIKYNDLFSDDLNKGISSLKKDLKDLDKLVKDLSKTVSDSKTKSRGSGEQHQKNAETINKLKASTELLIQTEKEKEKIARKLIQAEAAKKAQDVEQIRETIRLSRERLSSFC